MSKKNFRRLVLAVLAPLWLYPLAVSAYTTEEAGAPQSLAAWESWVLFGYEEQYRCPLVADEQYVCAWPVDLTLTLDETGGRFELEVEVLNEDYYALPGGPGSWPLAVTDAEGRTLPVLGQDQPRVFLPPGRQKISGRFEWTAAPDSLFLPLGYILHLSLNGRPIAFPGLEVNYQDERARLWLKRKKSLEAQPATSAQPVQADSLSIAVTRLITDSQPQMVRTRLKLTVSGQERETFINNILLPQTQATFLSSDLPAQLSGPNLRVLLRPGVHEILVDARSLTRSESLGPLDGHFGEEYWAFIPQPELRQIEIEGAPQVDPQQVDLPDAWRGYPLYRLSPGESLTFQTIRRGDPEPDPDRLTLNRQCWLDYSGQSLSCRDQLTGVMSRQRHLNTSPPLTLNQASLDGQPQVITLQIDSQGREAPGLQLRRGRLDLTADLRLDHFDGLLPASGWDHDLETTWQTLNLPPGYQLFSISGAQAYNLHGQAAAWLDRWGALDFFVVLIVVFCVLKLYGPPWALLALLALGLSYHELWSPKMVFIHILATVALLRVLPNRGTVRALVQTWRWTAIIFLLGLALVFTVIQARQALHPQLENPNQTDISLGGFLPSGAAQNRYYEYPEAPSQPAPEPRAQRDAPPEPMEMAVAAAEMEVYDAPKMMKSAPAGLSSLAFSNFNQLAGQAVNLAQAPESTVQNGPGRPQWQWRTINLNYNGQVAQDQVVSMTFLTPVVNRLLSFSRIILMAWLVVVMLRIPAPKGGENRPRTGWRKLLPASLSLLLTFLLGWAAPSGALADGDFPDRGLLEAYRQRLLDQPETPPPGLAAMHLNLRGGDLRLSLEAAAGERTVLPLPVLDADIFQPTRVSLGTGETLPIFEYRGQRLILLPAGEHTVVLEGKLSPGPASDAFQMNFPYNLRPQKISAALDGWTLEGLTDDGRLLDESLFLARQGMKPEIPTASEAPETGPAEAAPAGPQEQTLSPFFLVERQLSLGLEWKVFTQVRRLTPLGAPVSLRLPLLPGETPTTTGFRAREGLLIVNFGPQDEYAQWESSLTPEHNLTLTAKEGPYAESWALDASPIWRVETDGPAPIHHFEANFWQPQWRPWPGEKLTLSIDRPQPAPGSYLALDQAVLDVAVGEENRRLTLNFSLRTSQGGPCLFSLPPGAQVQELKLNGQSISSAGLKNETPDEQKPKGPTLTLPLTPGEHEVEVVWLDSRPVSLITETPALDLGLPAANLDIELRMPQTRWLLFTGGPLQGPAILFWSLMAAILLAAFGLAGTKLTPLGVVSWFLLGLGLCQLSLPGAGLVAGWLLVLGLRRKKPPIQGALAFNLTQIGLVLWTFLALSLIYQGIETGLLDHPDMSLTGNGSRGYQLYWFQDMSDGPWPQAWVLSLPEVVYKALMLAWSLWLAFNLIRWLRWGWAAFSAGGAWKRVLKHARRSHPETDGRPETKMPEEETHGKKN